MLHTRNRTSIHSPLQPTQPPCSVPSASQTRYQVVCSGTLLPHHPPHPSAPASAYPSHPAIHPNQPIYISNPKPNRKIPWRLSRHQKSRQRERLRHVDTVVATIDAALARQGTSMKKVEVWKKEMPTEQEMLPRDKYTVFDKKVKRYRKGIHSKWHLK
jgi:hypothetical protein